jgi:uncharacterized membrane protein YjjP (DUF1212 family)
VGFGLRGDRLTVPAGPDDRAALTELLACLLRFGELMLRAGNAAFRVREWMGALARAMGIESLAVHVTLGGMTATAWRGAEHVTLANEIAPVGINAWRIGALERLARTAEAGVSARAVGARLAAIEAEPPIHSLALVAVAMGGASGAFSYLNGGGPSELLASVIAGGIGQAARSLLFRRRLNQYAVTAVCAVVASGIYCLIMAALGAAGIAVPVHAAGFISSVLFLVPGFPLVAALLDLLQHQTTAGIARLAYSAVVVVAGAFALSLVAAAAGLTAQAPPPLKLDAATATLLRAVASMVGGCAFAILYNSSRRTVLVVGGLSLIGNGLRLSLHDRGLSLALATFVGALAVALLVSAVRHRLHEPRIALTVPSIIIMTPGIYLFQTVVLLGEGDALAGLRTAVLGGFVIGGMALGLAAGRFVTDRASLIEA